MNNLSLIDLSYNRAIVCSYKIFKEAALKAMEEGNLSFFKSPFDIEREVMFGEELSDLELYEKMDGFKKGLEREFELHGFAHRFLNCFKSQEQKMSDKFIYNALSALKEAAGIK